MPNNGQKRLVFGMAQLIVADGLICHKIVLASKESQI